MIADPLINQCLFYYLCKGNLKTAACFLRIEKLTIVNLNIEVEKIMTAQMDVNLKRYSVIKQHHFMT